jgi:hypothetical protein
MVLARGHHQHLVLGAADEWATEVDRMAGARQAIARQAGGEGGAVLISHATREPGAPPPLAVIETVAFTRTAAPTAWLRRQSTMDCDGTLVAGVGTSEGWRQVARALPRPRIVLRRRIGNHAAAPAVATALAIALVSGELSARTGGWSRTPRRLAVATLTRFGEVGLVVVGGVG